MLYGQAYVTDQPQYYSPKQRRNSDINYFLSEDNFTYSIIDLTKRGSAQIARKGLWVIILLFRVSTNI